MKMKVWEIGYAAVDSNMGKIRDEIARSVSQQKSELASLLFEEAFVNVASYAYPKEAEEKPLRIELSCDTSEEAITLIDKGVAFNPVAYVPPAPDANQIGGHGIRMLQSLSKGLRYTRTAGNENVLKIFI